MRGWVVREWGPPGSMRLEDVEEGTPAAGQVRLRVRAAGLNFGEALEIAGQYQVKPDLPFVPGWEAAGEVVSAADGAPVRVGDRVVAGLDNRGLTRGSLAEIADADPASITALPPEMPFEDAAAFMVTYQTAHFALHRRAQLRPGETLLVHGGAGGVGSAAIQLGKAAGATVIATAGSPSKVEVCRTLGADHAINYRERDFADAVREITDGRGAEVIYDPVGGDVFDRSTKCVAFEGRILVVGFASGRIPEMRLNHPMVKNYSVVGLHRGLYRQRDPALVAATTQELFRLYREGLLKPLISERRPLEEAAAALADVAAGRTTGKVVVVV